MKQNRKILIVDDNPENIEILVDNIEATQQFFDVIVASNGQKTLEILDKTLVDIIIMDWQMPELDGIETLKRLKKTEKLKEIPVIIISAMMITMENLSFALKNGAVDFLRHPINKTELWARINSALTISDYTKQIRFQEKIIAQNQKGIILKGVEQIQNELTIKNEDNTRLQFQLIEINNNNENIIKDLTEILNIVNEQDKDYINNLINKYKNKNIKNIPNIERKISQINDTFYQKLTNLFPNLTLNEKKICGFLKLNLSTKEISNLINRTEESIDKARLRLRKKLNISRNISIHNYFDSLGL